MKGQGAMDHRDKARDNGEHEDSAEPSVRQMASGPAERAIFGRRGPWGFLGLVAAIMLFIIVAGTVFYSLNA